jgi:trigger factor
MVSELSDNLARQGMNLDLYCQFTGQTQESLKESMKEDAEKRVKFQVIIAAVAKAENIEVSDEDYDNQIKELAEIYSRDADEIRKIFTGNEERLKADIANQKALDFVKENVAK